MAKRRHHSDAKFAAPINCLSGLPILLRTHPPNRTFAIRGKK